MPVRRSSLEYIHTTPHCGSYCYLIKGKERHYHSGSKRRGHVRHSTGLRNSRTDDIAPRHGYDVTDRGAIRAAERIHAYSPHE